MAANEPDTSFQWVKDIRALLDGTSLAPPDVKKRFATELAKLSAEEIERLLQVFSAVDALQRYEDATKKLDAAQQALAETVYKTAYVN